MKKYENPMLHVVSINRNDIIVTSETISFGEGKKAGGEACAPGMRGFDEWDAGY